MSLRPLQDRDTLMLCAWPNRVWAKEQHWWLMCHCKHLCGIINTWFELKISHPNVGQGHINPVPAELGYLPAPLFPNGYLLPLCPFSSFNASPTSSTTRRGHKQISGCCLGTGMRSGGRHGEPRSEVPHSRPFWKIPFLPIRDKNISTMLK